MDFGLTEEQIACLLREGLDLVANRARYSLRELFGTFIALHRPDLRGRRNLLARESSMYCSALMQHLFRKTGLDLAPGVDLKNTTPEDIARTALPHFTICFNVGCWAANSSGSRPACAGVSARACGK